MGTDEMAGALFCYVIMAHTDAPGVLRLVARIRELSPEAAIVVRHEDPALIGPAELGPLGAIDLRSDVRVRWGSWTMVRAMLEALTAAAALTAADHITLISGQDYPIRDLARWERELAATGAQAVLAPMGPNPRGYARHFGTFRLPGPLWVPKRAVHWGMDRMGRRTRPYVELYRLQQTGPDVWWFSVPRRGGVERPPWYVKASMWMTLRRDIVQRIVAEADAGGSGLRRARTMLVPDEVAVQSLASELADRLVHAPTSALHFGPGASSRYG
jgi:hypothetical protein